MRDYTGISAVQSAITLFITVNTITTLLRKKQQMNAMYSFKEVSKTLHVTDIVYQDPTTVFLASFPSRIRI